MIQLNRRIGSVFMYIDLIVLLVLLIVVVVFSRRFSSFVFGVAIIDIFLRILAFIKHNIPMKDVANIISKYLPESVFDIIDKYVHGSNMEIINHLLKWCFVGIMCIFLFYITKIFLKRKKI